VWSGGLAMKNFKKKAKKGGKKKKKGDFFKKILKF